MKLNTKTNFTETTHEGAIAKRISPEMELRRSVMCCMLWESTFYEEGESVVERIKNNIPKVKPELVSGIAIEAREKMKLRHVPLLIVREMARIESHKFLVAETLERVIQRPDELTEFLAIYWKEGRQPLSGQVKKGLAKAFLKFSEYHLAKYNRDGQVKLRDVLFLVHPKANDKKQQKIWDRLVSDNLKTPDTWEVLLGSQKDKKKTWESLIKEGNIGALALLRNLRNMQESGVDEKIIRKALKEIKTERVLPFRFISASKYAPNFESELEQAMFKCLESYKKLKGKTVLVIDVSGSMDSLISDKSELTRLDSACAIAMLLREICDDVKIYTFSNQCIQIPARRGFALKDVIENSQEHSGTHTGNALENINSSTDYDRIIVITDEQSHDTIPNPKSQGYFVNVAIYKNGIGYGKWTHIDGWSESIIDFILEMER